MTENEIAMEKIKHSYVRIINEKPFYGIMLAYMRFVIDDDIENVSTDAKNIYFNRSFLMKLSDNEVYYLLQHEIMHIMFQHMFRRNGRNINLFNLACDIVVDSWLLNELKFDKEDFLTIEYPTHTALNGVEGNQYSAEEVYDMFVKGKHSLSAKSKLRGKGYKIESKDGNKNDSHKNWEMMTANEKNKLSDIVKQRIINAHKMAEENFSHGYSANGNILYEKMFGELTQKNADWIKKLNNFLQIDCYDYSFTKTDYRYDDLPFFMPYFDVVDSQATYDVWFVIDVSGSISENDLAQALSEILSSIAQMNGLLKGYYSFFSNQISEPLPFENTQDISLKGIQTTGGTSFDIIFNMLKIWPKDKLPSNIVILSDGNCDYPKKEAALGIPTLWLINNDKITPPWGIVARME